MALSVLVMIKEEVTCPVCLHLMVEPVSADCGHSFCHVCITLNYDSSKGKKAKGICPVCGVSFRFGTLRSNRHVANIVERLKRFKCCPEEKQKVFYCPWHREKLQLLCEKDMVAICNLCEGSQDHLDHKPAPIEEVAYKYEEKLQAALQMQMANEKRCEEWGDDYRNALTYWVNQIHSEEENVQMEFKGLREFLDSKEKSELQKLMQEKEGIMNSLAESQTELEKQREAVRDLISDVEHQLKCSTIEMLQGVNSVLTRSQALKVKQPEMVPRKQRRIFRAPDMKGMLQVFQGLMDAQRYWVHVPLSQVRNEHVAINMEKRQIQRQNGYGRNLPISETYIFGVLGFTELYAGKHYWEVDVSKCDSWLLGLNDGKCAKPQLDTLNEKGIKSKYASEIEQHVNYQHEYAFDFRHKYDFDNKQYGYQCKYEVKDDSDKKLHVNYQPKHGYWVIGMTNRSVYNAFVECSVTHNASVLVLSLTRPPSRVGVFLDREACTLSFYDVSNHGALIYKFYEPSFPDAVFPYFNPMESSEPMTVCGPPPS
ncbi:tripartite motif-containing protein 30A [Mesocricetus auratus]|uniref:Tripartite motif-containing protein 30A n=1 Tax=Mesocricetus auratus TaxID=10036 RepID=A0ABM2YEE1_MESAU|nr:tripartite motif-containing protein 30A [Mesocricetus auratus]XP_040613157.1 tripartite motif-containing protein 30A [Mesocricetus auratus]